MYIVKFNTPSGWSPTNLIIGSVEQHFKCHKLAQHHINDTVSTICHQCLWWTQKYLWYLYSKNVQTRTTHLFDTVLWLTVFSSTSTNACSKVLCLQCQKLKFRYNVACFMMFNIYEKLEMSDFFCPSSVIYHISVAWFVFPWIKRWICSAPSV